MFMEGKSKTMKFSDLLKAQPDLRHLKPATQEEIQQAEQVLMVSFSDEYKEYLLTLGVAAVGSHEFAGICSSPRLNVVDATLRERELQGHDCDTMYVVEQEGIDHIVIWQDVNGKVYKTIPGVQPLPIALSLADRLSSLLYEER
jgi:hypothetical protein